MVPGPLRAHKLRRWWCLRQQTHQQGHGSQPPLPGRCWKGEGLPYSSSFSLMMLWGVTKSDREPLPELSQNPSCLFSSASQWLQVPSEAERATLSAQPGLRERAPWSSRRTLRGSEWATKKKNDKVPVTRSRAPPAGLILLFPSSQPEESPIARLSALIQLFLITSSPIFYNYMLGGLFLLS